MSAPDTRQPIFDPGLDVATVVFSHVQCVKTRHSLAVVSKLWREASKPAAAYPLEFEFDAGSRIWHRGPYVWDIRDAIELLDNDEALSLPYERVDRLLGDFCGLDKSIRVCRSLWEYKTAEVDARAQQTGRLGPNTCQLATYYGHLPVLQYLHENGCPWDDMTCWHAAQQKHWDCLQYAVDNKCRAWERYAEEYAKHLR